MGGNGALEFADGKRYGFHKLSFWTNRWGFSDEQGKVIMSIHPSLLRREGEVALDEGLTDRHANMLMVLGWYMVIQLIEEGEMAAASAAT
jgi:hypothetical protein